MAGTSDHPRPAWAVELEAERRRHGWGKWEAARRLYATIGVTNAPDSKIKGLATQITGHEAGRHYPRTWDRGYAAIYGRTVEDLFGSGESVGASSNDDAASDIDDDVRRRALLGLLASAASAPLVQRAEHLRAAVNQAMDGVATDRDSDAWERVAFDYAHEVGVLPAAELLPELLADIDELKELLRAATDGVRSRLTHSAAQLAALTAITLTNLGDMRGARRWWRTAARAADESGDYLAASLIRGRQAVFSLYEDRPTGSALDLAEEAIAIGRAAPCAGVASGYAAKAQALAKTGRHADAAAALHELEELVERLPDHVSQDQASQWGWSAQRLHHVASHVYTFAGNLEKAGRAQDQALALYPAGNYQGRAQVELHRAGCLMRAGDVDAGARHTIHILQGLPAEHADDGLLRRTALTSLSLAPQTSTPRPALRDAYAQLAITAGDEKCART